LVMLDAGEGVTDEDRIVIETLRELERILVINRTDLASLNTFEAMRHEVRHLGIACERIFDVSAKTGNGISELQREMAGSGANDASVNGFLVTDARHFDLLSRSTEEILESARLAEEHTSEELILVGLHNALRSLGQITGETTTEDMLTR